MTLDGTALKTGVWHTCRAQRCMALASLLSSHISTAELTPYGWRFAQRFRSSDADDLEEELFAYHGTALRSAEGLTLGYFRFI